MKTIVSGSLSLKLSETIKTKIISLHVSRLCDGGMLLMFSLSSAVSGEKTPGVSGPTPPDVAETRASAHPEDPPDQPDALHWSQVQ